MQIAFCLYKYFPYGGLQRDFLRIARAAQAAGAAVRVYVLSWQGEVPAGFERVIVPVKAWSNARRYAKFSAWVAHDLAQRPVDKVVGFNKMPGLDVYFAADACYEEKARSLRHPLYRFSGRYRHFSAYERAVFAADAGPQILLIAPAQQAVFQHYYATPEARFHLLPPGISRDRCAPPDADHIRAQFREEFGLAAQDFLLLQVGSGFKTKGLDRSLLALAHLPPELRARTRLVVIGQDEPSAFRRMAANLGLTKQVEILAGRNDIPRFLLGADLLVHPAYNENTGTVLLEALVAGLPVLCTAVCGYAPYVVEAAGGQVLAEPFAQEALDAALLSIINDSAQRRQWQLNALNWAQTADIYSNAERAVEIIMQTPGQTQPLQKASRA
ncbi:glycosyltransferase family 4 protein [Azonexus sp.]|uniref:glycosyltransferase family 4 protein n=1 Tax=Azonexus sp. TaxID=1872668 RepID=UPI0039E4D2EA